MKKLFTFAILLVATMGYAQILSEGELDYSTYDWQTNWANINRTIVWPDGKVNFAYTVSDESSFSDRGTGIGTYNSNNDQWIPLGGRIESEKTYFGSIARYGENGIVVAAHTATMCGLYIVEDKDNMTPNSVPATSYLSPTYEPTCPVVMTSGSNRDIIHVLATGNDNKLYYYRSHDGLTWDAENVILPYLTEEYCSHFGNNMAYWMETTENNCLAFVVNNPWSDGMVIYSYDDGQTWERKVFYHHPGINNFYDGWFMYPRWTSCVWDNSGELCLAYEFNASNGEPGNAVYYPGIGGIAFWSETMPYHGSTLPQWGCDPTNPMPLTPGQPFIMDSAYIYEDIYLSWDGWSDATHEMWPEYFGYLDPSLGNDTLGFNIFDPSLHGDYYCGPVAMPVLCKVPNTDDDLVAVWMALDENNMDGNGNYYFKLFASYSNNGGLTWFPQVLLFDSFLYELSEFVYPQVAVIGNKLIVVAQIDSETGTSIQGDDYDSYDNYFGGMAFDLYELFPVPPMPIGNSEWYYEIENENGSITYQHLECVGDTLFANGKRPKIIVRSNTHYDRDTITITTHEYLYEEWGFVYWWNRDNQEFTTLYNLNANAGDEWIIRMGAEIIIVHVNSVENIVYEGQVFRVMHVSDDNDLFNGDIVCGIGHLTSFFPERLMRDTEGFRVDGLRCYWVDNELVFKYGDEDCDAIYGDLHSVEENGPSTGSVAFAVYPNPATGVLFVQSHAARPNEEYRIINLTGQTLLQGTITAENQQINIEKLPAGMYFVSVGGQTLKFVVK